MTTSRRSRVVLRVTIVFALVALTAAYLAAYFYSGTVADSARPADTYEGTAEWEDGTARWIEMRHRTYKHAWQSVLFSPAAAVESLVVGKEVHAVYSESR